jgi:hypothetical protein
MPLLNYISRACATPGKVVNLTLQTIRMSPGTVTPTVPTCVTIRDAKVF